MYSIYLRFWWGLLVLTYSVESIDETWRAAGVRTRRLINGRPLTSHDIYKTTYFVQLKEVWKCLTNQYDHQLNDCQQSHWCTGSLINPQFVMTACHCISYLVFYSGEYKSATTTEFPKIPKDPWSLHAEPYRSWSYPFHNIELRIKMKIEGYHPLTNSMSIFAGSVDIEKMTQRRHAAAFFPHTLCRKKREEIYVGDTNIYPIEYDIGLVKSCYPFKLDRGITVAPIHPTTNLAPDLKRALMQNKVCLYAGWGYMLARNEKVGGRKVLPEILQYQWRHIDCSQECTFGMKCVICSHHQGTVVSHPTRGDSGLPVICDGKVVGVHNSGAAFYSDNLTYAMDFAIACAAPYLAAHYLEQLRKLKDKIFHWLDGKPITYATKRYKRHVDNYNVQEFPLMSLSTQLLPNISLIVIILILLHRSS